MTSGRDLRDMLGLPVGGPEQKAMALKKAKPAGLGRRMQGVAREVAALYGERPPPVAVYEEKKAYRAKRQSTGPVKKWVQQPFSNQARSDGLILKHWRRKQTVAPAVQEGEDILMEGAEGEEPYVEDSEAYLKYNISVDLPTFTDEEYDAHLRSEDWSREETDYLFEVVKDYSYRWAVIWDRYDYQPASNSHLAQDAGSGEAQALAALPFAPPKQRTVEDLKARFYDISAKLMKLRIPEMQMDADQYALYETLTKFDPILERNRKTLAAALMNRSMDEVKEEEFLLTELQRINMAANRLDAEREELRARLDAPAQNASVQAGLASFTSSQALQALFQQLFQQDRSKKRTSGTGTGPGRLSLNTNDLIQTPSAGSAQMSAAARRQSTAASIAQTPIRMLPPQQEHRYNVSTHERLQSGVTFGSDKLLKMRQAKSNVQTQKIAAALAELGIADVISIPTSRVGEVFERLVGKVGRLLDVRKVREKEEGECRVLLAMKERRGGEGEGGDGGDGGGAYDGSGVGEGGDGQGDEEDEEEEEEDADGDGDADADADEADVDADADGDADEDNADADADGDADADADPDADEDEDEDEDEDGEGEEESRQPSESASVSVAGNGNGNGNGRGRKRSASVLSAASEFGFKRARK